MKKEIIAGNWKMYKTQKETEEYFINFCNGLNISDREVMLFVPYTNLAKAVESAKDTNIQIGSQNFHYEDFGAFTGEISIPMLREIGVNLSLIGHSERRKYFNETNESVNRKVIKALSEDLIPIVCIGESLEERENNETFKVLQRQIDEGLKNAVDQKLIIAYEPVWAIGTGKNATNEQAEEACAFIRNHIKSFDTSISEEIRILYGGSVNVNNIKGIMAQENIDGVLVGGASLEKDFVKIVNYDE